MIVFGFVKLSAKKYVIKKKLLCNSNLANDVFRKNNKSSIVLISYINWTLLITIMDLKMEAWNYLILSDDKQVWRAKQVRHD